jgi:hypothetical protein
MTDPHDERTALGTFLRAQRSSVLAIVEGLDDPDLRRPAVPSGWTVLGMIEHLGRAERLWFQQVIAAAANSARDRHNAEPEGDGGPFATSRPVQEVFAFYREQAARSDEILANTPLDSTPAGRLPPGMTDEIHTVRDIVLHMLEETARHAGHLDIARELLDGKTGLGPR